MPICVEVQVVKSEPLCVFEDENFPAVVQRLEMEAEGSVEVTAAKAFVRVQRGGGEVPEDVLSDGEVSRPTVPMLERGRMISSRPFVGRS
jgi:hypothetical protein